MEVRVCGIRICPPDAYLGIPNCTEHILSPKEPSGHALERICHFFQGVSKTPGLAVSGCECQENPFSLGKVWPVVKKLMHLRACSLGTSPLADWALSLFAVERNRL